MTALMFAVKVGSFDVVKLLVEHSANLFAVDSVSTSINMSHDHILFCVTMHLLTSIDMLGLHS